MTEIARQENQSPADIVSQVQGIFQENFQEQIDKLRFIRELTMNLCGSPDIGRLGGERVDPIHGLHPILEDVTKAHDAAMAMVDELAKKHDGEGAS